jgi:hypothetical protein
MKSYYPILLLCVLVLSSVVSYGANINGWGGDQFFTNNEPTSSFSLGFETTFNQSNERNLTIGSSSVSPVSCDVFSSYAGNELIIASGSTIEIFTGQGNSLTSVYSYSTQYTILALGCIGNNIYIGTSGEVTRLQGSQKTMTEYDVGLDAGYDITCSYSVNTCAINYGFGIEFIDGTNPNTRYTSEYNAFTHSDKIFFESDKSEVDDYMILQSGTSFWYYHILNGTRTAVTFISTSGTSYKEYFGIFDINDDGKKEICKSSTWTVSSTAHMYNECKGISGQFFSRYNSKTMSPFTQNHLYYPIIVRTNNNLYYCYGISHGGNQYGECYSSLTTTYLYPLGLADYHTTTILQPIPIYPYLTTEFYTISALGLYKINVSGRFINYTFTGDTDYQFSLISDISGDFSNELIRSKAGKTSIIFSQPINMNEVPTSITFASNTIHGGFFGYYQGDVCLNTTVTFRAQECIGDLTSCNYYNSNNEKERLRVDCGNGQINTGSFSTSSPFVTCYYNETATEEVILYIQSESNPDTLNVNNANTPIELSIINSPSCNGAVYSQPVLIGNPFDSGNNQPPTEPVTPPSENGGTGTTFDTSIFGVVQDNIKLIVAMIIIITIVGTMASNGIRNPVILLFGAVAGLIITTALGLIGTGALVLMIIVIIALFLLSMTVFKSQLGD